MFNCLERSNLLKINQLWKNNDCLDCLETRMYCLGGLAHQFLAIRTPLMFQKLVEKSP